MRTLEPLDQYTITSRGQCYSVIQPDPPLKLGEVVLVPMVIAGIESFAVIGGADPGRSDRCERKTG